MENSNQSSKKTTIILGVLLLLAILVGGYFWNQTTNLTAENQELNAEVETLSGLRDDLLEEIDDLHSDYDELMSVNDSMKILFAETSDKVEAKRAEIKRIKSDFAKDAKGMQTEIDQLRTIKKDLTAVIAQLKKENARLTAANAQLTGDVAAANERNKVLEGEIAQMKQLNIGMEKELKKLAAANSRVTNMRVDVKKANDKITSSHNRAREIVVSFDLKSIPKDKLKEERLYLVITDAKGTPIKVKNPVSTTINPNTGGDAFPIIAQQTIRATLQNGIRLQFIQALEEKLRGGAYRVSVYADWGLLGSSQFQLR
jgi:cell division protein FtsB